jgi:heat shock protein HtpX
MELWSEPMSGQAMALLLVGMLLWFVLIAQEIRSYSRDRARRRATAEAETVAGYQIAEQELPPLHTLGRTAFLLALLAFPFLVAGARFGVAAGVLSLASLLAVMLWSLWQAGPAMLARCAARPVTDADLIGAVEELAAKAGIPPPHLLETPESHPNAFALCASPKRAAIILTHGLRIRLSAAELRAILGHEVARIVRRDTAKDTLGVALLSPIAALATRLGLIGPSVRAQGAGALLFLLMLAPLSALVLSLSAATARAYRADRAGALLCGSPENLIAALSKLDASAARFESITAKVQPTLAVLCVVDPLPQSWVGHLFAAQPRTARRIARLRALATAAEPAPA